MGPSQFYLKIFLFPKNIYFYYFLDYDDMMAIWWRKIYKKRFLEHRVRSFWIFWNTRNEVLFELPTSSNKICRAIIPHSKQKPCQYKKSLSFSNSRNLWWQALALRSNHQTRPTATQESHCFHVPTGFIVVSCVSVRSCFEILRALDLRFGRNRRFGHYAYVSA